MGARSDHSPRIALVLQPGLDVQESLRESLATLRGELDAEPLDCIGDQIGALSRTQTPQPAATEGYGLRLWVSA